MKARLIKEATWEQQFYWLLENGVTVCVEHNQCYGDFIKSMEQITPNGVVKWYASSGFVLPKEFDFAQEWREVVNKSDHSTLIRPKFQTIF